MSRSRIRLRPPSASPSSIWARTRCALSSSSGSARALFPLFNEKVMCGLGRGIASTGRLNPEGVALALVNLRRFVAFARAIGVDHLAVLATAAVRDASDGRRFCRRGRTPVPRAGQDHRRSGGGATVRRRSARRDSGCGRNRRRSRRRQRRAGSGWPGTLSAGEYRSNWRRASACRSGRCALPNSATAQGLSETIERALAGVSVLRAAAGKKLYLVGGAARAIARLHMEHTQYPLHIIHQYTITRREAEGFLDIIGRQSRKSLERITTISRKRLEVVPLAALILRKLIAVAGPQSVVFSALGLREGYAYGLIPAEERIPDPLIAAIWRRPAPEPVSPRRRSAAAMDGAAVSATSRKQRGVVIGPPAGSAIWPGASTPTTAPSRPLPEA